MSRAHQPVTEELRRWIVSQAEAGCRPDDVLAAMCTSGWAEDVAVAALKEALLAHLGANGAPQPALAPAAALPATAMPGLASPVGT